MQNFISTLKQTIMAYSAQSPPGNQHNATVEKTASQNAQGDNNKSGSRTQRSSVLTQKYGSTVHLMHLKIYISTYRDAIYVQDPSSAVYHSNIFFVSSKSRFTALPQTDQHPLPCRPSQPAPSPPPPRRCASPPSASQCCVPHARTGRPGVSPWPAASCASSPSSS